SSPTRPPPRPTLFPYTTLFRSFGVANDAPAGMIPATVRYSFWAGGIALFAAVMWTVLSTREYGPEEMAAFGAAEELPAGGEETLDRKSTRLNSSHEWISYAVFC